ncbi:MAG: hypothetical protein ACKPEY_13095 [Planctomycetota bacterium]
MTEGESGRPRINPQAMSIGDAARLLTSLAGGVITDEMLKRDIVAGAPTNADGTFNLVHYAAWLCKEMGRGD